MVFKSTQNWVSVVWATGDKLTDNISEFHGVIRPAETAKHSARTWQFWCWTTGVYPE